ncbi:CARDB domain-containing protein [Chloroflexota bacterium]
MAYTTPAAFTVSNLAMSPGEASVGENVAISVDITNTGDLAGSYEATFDISDVITTTREIKLDGHTSEKVTFITSKNIAAGEYSVRIDGQYGTFTVESASTEP